MLLAPGVYGLRRHEAGRRHGGNGLCIGRLYESRSIANGAAWLRMAEPHGCLAAPVAVSVELQPTSGMDGMSIFTEVCFPVWAETPCAMGTARRAYRLTCDWCECIDIKGRRFLLARKCHTSKVVHNPFTQLSFPCSSAVVHRHSDSFLALLPCLCPCHDHGHKTSRWLAARD